MSYGYVKPRSAKPKPKPKVLSPKEIARLKQAITDELDRLRKAMIKLETDNTDLKRQLKEKTS